MTGAEIEVWQGVSPIFGADLCCFLRQDRHIRVPTLGNFGASLGTGFYLGIDIQPEGTQEQIILGSGSTQGTTLLLRYNDEGSPGVLSLELRDEDGRRLSAIAQASELAAKRL